MRFFSSTLMLVAFVNLATAQGGLDSFSISMSVSPLARLNGGDLACKIERRGENFKFSYKYRDSIGLAYYQDKRTRPLLQSYLATKSAKTLDSIHHLENEYSFYREDSLFVLVRDYASFAELLGQILTTPKERLEDLEADKKIAVLDGAIYSFQLQTAQRTTTVNSLNLDSTLLPLLYRLSTEVFGIYKKEKHRDFLGAPLTLAFCNSDLTAKGEQNIFTEPKNKRETAEQ